MVIASDERQAELLAAVRRMEPRHLVRLAGLWAGVAQGTLDRDRQHRRNAARLALRYVSRREERSLGRGRALAAAAAVCAVAGTKPGSLAGPMADAAFALTDALDALAHRDRLTPAAYEELLQPWSQLLAEVATEGRNG